METLIHADIFFFVSTIAVVVVSAGIAIALVYIIRILRNVSVVSDRVKVESEELMSDLDGLRSDIKREGFRLSTIWRIITYIINRSRRGSKSN